MINTKKSDRLVMITMIVSLVALLSLMLTACTSKDLPNNSTSVPETNATIIFIFEPKSCVETPWEILAKNSSIRWIKAPTDTEMITTLYVERYGVTIRNAEKIQTADAVCMACGVCGTGYTFRIVVDEKDKELFIADGWTIESPNAQIANPASVNCIKNNGTLEIRNEADGQVGYCTLPNGNICEEWSYFRGTCS